MRIHRLATLMLVVPLMLTASGRAFAAEPIRVGFMAPLTGIFAQPGKEMLEGLKLALEHAGYQTAGLTEYLFDRFAFAGTPEEIRGKVQRLQALGIERFLLNLSMSEDIERDIRLLAQALTPAAAIAPPRVR